MLPNQGQLIRVNNVPSHARLLNYDHHAFRIPTGFSLKDHCSLMEVGDNGLSLFYTGPGDVDAATARSECEIPPQCGIYYFEMTIKDKGRDGFLAVGLITKASLLKKLVGWETGTIGYHGDDGCVYMGSGTGHAFGPTYTTGDVIGCGVNFVRKRIFFTKNGTCVGDKSYPLSQSRDLLYAAFGMKSPGEAATANFGASPFSYDIERYILEEQRLLSLEMASSVDVRLIEPPVIEVLLLKHLVHMGCEKTVLSFFRSALGSFQNDPRVNFTEADLLEMLQRSKTRCSLIGMILSGKIEALLTALHTSYPTLLLKNPDLDFLLQCRLFIESVSRRLMQKDDKAEFIKIFTIGQILEEKLQFVTKREYHGMARDALALIAYKSLTESPSAYLLSESHRQQVASVLEEALLREDELSVYSPLERLIRAYQVNVGLLREIGHDQIALIEPLSNALRSHSIKPE